MGKSSQVLANLVSVHKTTLHKMNDYSMRNMFLRLLNNNEDTFLLHQLQNDTSLSHAFDLGEFFNMQDSGLTMKDLSDDPQLKKYLQPIATFEGSGYIPQDHINVVIDEEDNYRDEREFVAIAEGRDIPVYVVTYNIEMTQFTHTAIENRIEQDEIIDKCIAARHHAQFVSHQIADEGRMSNHRFDTEAFGPISKHLIRNYPSASVEYSVIQDESSTQIDLPPGLEQHDIYIITGGTTLK